MAFAKRIFLFLAVNVLIVATISIMMSLFGVQPYLSAQGINYESLLIYCFIWGMTGAFISLALSRVMAKFMMGVKVIDPQTTQRDEAELLHTVYRLAKSAGMTTMPEVGVYNSPEVNAFATGPSKNRALVAVSAGLLNRMNQPQLEGVLGHEISHVVNGDMVTMTLVQGILNSFVLFLSRAIAFVISQNAKEESRFAIRMVVTLVLDIILTLLASFVVAFFSRYREFRADAGGAKVAGRDKMIDALKALKSTTELIDPNTQQAIATLKISSKPAGLMALLSSHPPLDERIARLEKGQY